MPNLWMINPNEQAESNPKRRRRHKKRTRKASARRAAPRRARASRNPANPPRHLRHHARARRRFARARRNPEVMGIDLMKVGIGALAAVGVDVGGEFAAGKLPATTQPGAKIALKYGIKATGLVLAVMALRKFAGRQAAGAAGVVGGGMIVIDALREFALPALKLPHGGLSGLGLTPEDLEGVDSDTPGIEGYSRRAFPLPPGVSPAYMRGSAGIARGGWRRRWGSAA